MRAEQLFFQIGCATSILALSSCASLPETPKGAACVLPSETPINCEAGLSGLIQLPIVLDSGEPLQFILETGSPYTVLDASLEPKLGESLGHCTSRSVYGVMPGHLFRAPALFLNGTQLQTGRRVRTADLSELSDALNRVTNSKRQILGVLGMDCLGHYCIQLDFTSRRVRFLDSRRLDKEALGKPFPLTFSRNAVYVNENLLGQATRTLVDTGCNFDGQLKTRAFGQWIGSKRQLVEEHGCGWFAGDKYTDLFITADGNLNVIGLRFLARHLVTFDVPSRMMYLNRLPTKPPGHATTGNL